MATRGFFGVGIMETKIEANVGMLMRSAYLYNASYIFTIGARYERVASDTPNAHMSIPTFYFENFDDFMGHIPLRTSLVGIEQTSSSRDLTNYIHPERAVYLLGAEDYGLPNEVTQACDQVVEIPTHRPYSMNVAVAGSIVMADRYVKGVK